MILLRRVTHVGAVEAAAFLVDPSLLGEAQARARVLSLCSRGVTVYGTRAGYLVRLPRSTRVAVGTAPGLPLVDARAGGVTLLVSAPLSEPELAALSPRRGGVVIARAGVAEVLEVPDMPVDVSQWVGLEGWSTAEAASLGDAPPPPRAATDPVATTARAIYGGAVPEKQPPEAAAITAALARAGGGDGSHAAPASGLRLALAGFLSTLHAVVSRAGGAEARGSSRSGVIGQAIAKVQTWLARVAVATRLATFLARRQSEYLGRLFDMLDRGDVESALRHAIPLGGGDTGVRRPMLGVPKPRSELAIAMSSGKSSSVLGVGDDVYGELRRRYRAVFERLERDGRIDEAAFVLAELLHETEAAVSFLERHGRLRQAATLAEARDLPTGLVVRQWFLAGDHTRAIRIARARGGYADAIDRLERSQKHDAAAALRLAWADYLASTGDFEGAVRTAWPVERGRRLAPAWLDAAIDQGGVGGARMLALKVVEDVGDPDATLQLAKHVVAAEGGDARRERIAFARALINRPKATAPLARPVARATLRALYADADHSSDRELPRVASDLRELAADHALLADRPTWHQAARQDARFTHHVAAADRGTRPVHDAAPLPRGRTAVALGEGGVALFTRSGAQAARFDQPATSLVISDRGDRAIAVARRGAIHRLARIDLANRRSEAWCEAEIDRFARSFDGSTWVAATLSELGGKPSDLLVIDALEPDLAVLHRFDAIGDGAYQIVRSPSRCEVLAGYPFAPLEGLSFELPAWTLRGRAEVGLRGRGFQAWGASTRGVYGAIVAERDDDQQQPAPNYGNRISLFLRGEHKPVDDIPVGVDAFVLGVQISDAFLVALLSTTDSLRAVVLDRAALTIAGEIILEGSPNGGMRLTQDHLLVHDDLGRVVTVELPGGQIVTDLRV